MVKWKALSLILSLYSVSLAWGQPNNSTPSRDLTCKPNISLSQKDVAELVLQQGRKTQETNLQYQEYRLAVAQARAVYQWDFLLQTGYLFDKSVSFAASPYDKQETMVTDAVLSKNFTTGTLMSVEYKRSSFKGDVNSAGVTNGSRSLMTQDLLGLNLEQNLWADFLGIADRADVDSAELSYKSKSLLRTNDLENLVLDTIRQFWATYVSQQNFKEAMASRDRSKKLVDAVKKKSGFGYANPGELAQAQADYEGRVQDVKSTSTTYLANLDNLNTTLSLPPNCDVNFVIPEAIPSVPQLPEKSIEDLRTIRSQKMAVQAAQRAYDSAKSKDAPTFKLVGKIYSYGVEDNGDGAYSDMVSGSHPQYYAGIKFEYPFGADLLGETRLNRKYAKDLEEVKLSRITQENQDSLAQAQRKVQSTYAAVLSSVEQKKYREQALKELTRSYSQGRTDISIYIDAMNKFSLAEIQYSQAIGNYQTALNEWAAARDELIPAAQEDY
jgi:outer membrane protein TolC